MTQGYDARIAWSGATHLSIDYPDSANVRHLSKTTEVARALEVEFTPHASSLGLFTDPSLEGCAVEGDAAQANPAAK
jgi:hypothetical protein